MASLPPPPHPLSIVPFWQTTAGKALTDFKKIRLQEDVMAVLRTFNSEQPSVKVGRCVCMVDAPLRCDLIPHSLVVSVCVWEVVKSMLHCFLHRSQCCGD